MNRDATGFDERPTLADCGIIGYLERAFIAIWNAMPPSLSSIDHGS